MNHSLLIHHEEESYSVALCDTDRVLDSIRDDKRNVSKNCISIFHAILQKQAIAKEDISFIAINNGPGSFNMLRALISTVNALNFTLRIPLIPLNGLICLLQEHQEPQWPLSIALANAYTNDLYYALQSYQEPININCKNSTALFHDLRETYPYDKIRFLGPGALLYTPEITALFGEHAFIKAGIRYASLEYIRTVALEAWKAHKTVSHVSPVYLKEMHYKKIRA